MPETSGLPIGSRAPDVSLLGADGTPVRLADYWQGGPLVLTFYHLAFTGG